MLICLGLIDLYCTEIFMLVIGHTQTSWLTS